jgi:IS5 family transposase
MLQFMEDYSDREMEKALAENLAVKWFCGFELTDETPDHSYFGKMRKRLGTENVAKIFNSIVEQLDRKGISGKVFTFIDSTAQIKMQDLVAKVRINSGLVLRDMLL